MELTEQLSLIVAGGMFGVVLGKFLDNTPDWVFWLVVLGFFMIMIFLLT